jgi:hypothetical protein
MLTMCVVLQVGIGWLNRQDRGHALAVSVKWELVEWFGVINGLRNTGYGWAEDVLVFAADGSIIADVYEVDSQSTVDFTLDADEVSVSWRDSAGMHTDIIRTE